MNINYRHLFNLTCSHNYYADRRKPDLSLHPTPGTQRRLRDARMLFRSTPNGLTVLYRALDDEVTPMVDTEELRLVFELKIHHPATFFTVTDLGHSPAGSNAKKQRSSGFIYFRNDPSAASSDPDQPEIMHPELMDSVRPFLFTYSFALSGSPDEVLFFVRDRSGDTVSSGVDTSGDPLPAELVKDADGVYRRQVDLRGKPAGKYTIVVRNRQDTETLREEVIYIDEDLAGRVLPGIVEINYEAGKDHLFGEIEEYEITFTRKETVWKYYIVNKNGKTALSEDFLIEDSSSEETDFYNPVHFGIDGDVPHSTIRVNGMDTMIFKSEDPIPFYEIPKPAVSLKKSEKKVLVKNLPNPSHQTVVKASDEGPESEIYVFI